MTTPTGNVRRRGALHKQRRVIVLVVPPVEELDLVGPVQALSAANRLAGRSIYRVEVVTNGKGLRVEGEGGLLSFLAHGHYKTLKADFDSLLIVYGLATRSARDRELFACNTLRPTNPTTNGSQSPGRLSLGVRKTTGTPEVACFSTKAMTVRSENVENRRRNNTNGRSRKARGFQ